MKCLAFLLFVGLSFSARCDFSGYFEIKVNHISVYNSSLSADQMLEMEYDSLEETDLIEINYNGVAPTAKSDYELHIKVENTTLDLEFINDAPNFALNMGWFTQFRNRKATIYLHHIKYSGSSSQQQIHKVVDLFIA